MIRKTFLIVCAIMFLGLTAYASSLMVKVDRPLTPKPDQALIVFMRPSLSPGKAMFLDDFGLDSSSVHDVSGNETKLVGLVKSGTKICCDVAPGEYTFMVIGEAVDFMKANVLAGKTYYVLIIPRFGFWTARFSFKPLRQSDLMGADFSKWDSSTYLVDNTPESEEWAKKSSADIEKKRARWWSAWSALPLEKQESMTLNLEDGR